MERCSHEKAVARIRRVDRIAVPLGPGQPTAFLHALGERDDFTQLTIFSALLTDLYPVFAQPGVRLLSGFYGPAERALAAAGHAVEFVPADFRRFAHILHELVPRVMVTAVAPPDEAGNLSLSLHAGATIDELRRCGGDPERLLIAEVNAGLPRTLGLPPRHTHSLHIDDVDLLTESDRPVFTLDDAPTTALERAIAHHARAYLRDGSTLQTGIGGIPNAIVSELAEGEGGDYGIHSEMFTTGLMELHRAGKVSNRKGVYDGVSISTFALGSRELYDWLDGQEAVRFLPVEAVNTPAVISQNREMVSINGALAVDLAGQIVADTLGGGQYSGIGGHEDFVSGASMAHEGRSLVCLPAIARRGQTSFSRILPFVPADTLVTTPRHQVDVVITEYGAAELAGRTVEERRQALIAIAHPDVREQLAAGREIGPLGPLDSP